jgi:hypothetical protein
MRFSILAGFLGATLALTTLPASAAWHGYVSREVGFSFTAPGEVKTEKATYAAQGARDAGAFRSIDNNIEYKVTVVNFTGSGQNEETLIKDAATKYIAGKKVLSNVDARVDQNYGRKLTVELPNNGGRSMAAFYYKNNHLIELEVTVLPANGDYETPDTGRFVDSIAFLDSRVEKDATEVKLPK